MFSSLTLLELLEVTMFEHESMRTIQNNLKPARYYRAHCSTYSYIHLRSMPAIKCHCTVSCDELLLDIYCSHKTHRSWGRLGGCGDHSCYDTQHIRADSYATSPFRSPLWTWIWLSSTQGRNFFSNAPWCLTTSASERP